MFGKERGHLKPQTYRIKTKAIPAIMERQTATTIKTVK